MQFTEWVTELNELELVWLSVAVSKHSHHFEQINFDVTQRMPYLQLGSVNATIHPECVEHFFSSAAPASSGLG
jgi:hypothetical protein